MQGTVGAHRQGGLFWLGTQTSRRLALGRVSADWRWVRQPGRPGDSAGRPECRLRGPPEGGGLLADGRWARSLTHSEDSENHTGNECGSERGLDKGPRFWSKADWGRPSCVPVGASGLCSRNIQAAERRVEWGQGSQRGNYRNNAEMKPGTMCEGRSSGRSRHVRVVGRQRTRCQE